MELHRSHTVPCITMSGDDDVEGESLNLQNLFSIRSIVINPSTPDDSLASILENLTTFLHTHHQPHHHGRYHRHHHVLSILSDASLCRPQFSQVLFNSILSLTSSLFGAANSCPRLAAESLSFLLLLSDSIPSLGSALDSLDDGLIVSLVFRPCVSVRRWILSNLMRFRVRPNVLVTVLLGLTKDPYPLVRKEALDGLATACKSGIVVDDPGIIEGCYHCAVMLLRDAEECVRAAAVRAVNEWGKMLVETVDEADKRDCTDRLFLTLCSVVRDMSVNVRLEAFYALGRVKLVSEDVLSQSLSKRVLGSVKEKKPLARFSTKNYEVHASSAAGAFVHGLEDEFSEVRQASCHSLCQHVTLSVQFASEAVTLMMDVLNDDSVLVRLEVMETLHHMVTFDCLKMQQAQMQMLLSTLADKSPQIRVGAVNILGSMKYPNMEMLKLSVESLLGGLEMYPQNEAEFLLSLFKVAQNNSKNAVSIIQDVYPKFNSAGEKLEFDGPRVIGLVVMAISASLSHEACFQQFQPRIFSYVAVFYERISLALGDSVDKDTLLTYLSSHGESGYASKDRDRVLGGVEGSSLNTNVIQLARSIVISSPKTGHNVSKIQSPCVSIRTWQQEPMEISKSVKLSFASIKSSWLMITSGCKSEALKALRSCKEELEFTMAESLEYAGSSAFGLQYICVVKLLTKLWEYHLPTRKHFHGMGQGDIALVKLDRVLLELRYRFMGLSKEDELHLLELVILGYLLRPSRFQLCCHTSKKLATAVSQAVLFSKVEFVVASDFVNHLTEISQDNIASINEVLYSPLHLKKLLDSFSLKDFAHLERIRHKKAELLIPGFDGENPLTFIPGLPVGIPLDITVHNATSKDRLWLILSLDESSEFVYLDLDDHGDCEQALRIVCTAPFYRTPNAVAFTLRISVGMECLSEDLHRVKVHGGPRHPLTHLCREKEVYLTVQTKC